jgi:hypothetical protein
MYYYIQLIVTYLKAHVSLSVVCVYPRAQAVAAAFVGQMEEEANKLRDAKSALESALSKGEALSDATVALSDANKAYHTASLQVRKNCSQPKPKAKAAA